MGVGAELIHLNSSDHLELVLWKMAGVMLIITALVLLVACKTDSRATQRTEFGRKWDASYTLKLDRKEVFYDGEDTETSSCIYKRDARLGKYQLWCKKRGLVVIEQKDASGKLWMYHRMDKKRKRCEKMRKWSLEGIWRQNWAGNMKDQLVDTYQEGNKIYLRYYHTSYDDELGGRFKRWWTTVYDTETGSYLPYKRDEYWNDWPGRYSFVSISNFTYTPTTMEWATLPDYC